ncbi:Abi family protein [Leuconostoc mesenteroides]|uniref:Abi family protein n=1 Tax=Leuconostoc mesenteroides TaxID=1245 RepID=UPI00338E46B8
MGTKPFKTHNQQLKILRDRGLYVPSTAKRSLENYGYYSIINGYKWSFLQRGTNGKPINPEQYVKDATFQEIEHLYDFDSELRSILFEALLKYEASLSAELAYRFSEAHPEEHSYLAINNFSKDSSQVHNVVATISSLSGVIKYKSTQKNAINHYVNKHRHVPLWVLVNFLTFGDFNYFYQILTNDIQIKIAQDFSARRRRTYNVKSLAITPDSIIAVNHLVNHFRNAVAHGEITFSKKIHSTPSLQQIKLPLGIQTTALNSQAGVFELIIALKVVVQKKTFKKLSRELRQLFSDYRNEFSSITFASILSDMNFPTNFADYLE